MRATTLPIPVNEGRYLQQSLKLKLTPNIFTENVLAYFIDILKHPPVNYPRKNWVNLHFMPGLALCLYIVFYDLFRPMEGIFFL